MIEWNDLKNSSQQKASFELLLAFAPVVCDIFLFVNSGRCVALTTANLTGKSTPPPPE